MGSLAEPNFFFLSLFFFLPLLCTSFFSLLFLFSSNFFFPFSCLPSFFISPILFPSFSSLIFVFFFPLFFSSPFCCFCFSLSSLYFILLISSSFSPPLSFSFFFLSFSPLIKSLFLFHLFAKGAAIKENKG